MKTRVLYFSNKKKMKLFADILCAKLEAKSDTIPPAYPCENEKLVVVCVTLGKEVPDALRRFIREFSTQRAHNVAFVIDGPDTSSTILMNEAREAGTNVIAETFTAVCGGLPFLGKVKPEEQKAIEEWIDRVLTELK